MFDNRVDYAPGGEFMRRRYDFIWGAGHVVEPRRGGSRDIRLAYYIPANRAPRGFNLRFDDRDRTLGWYQANHPDWVVYRCPGGVEPSDPARALPAYYLDENGDHLVPLDVSNPEVVAWQVERYGKYTSTLLAPGGYDALGVDNVFLDNVFGFCGVFAHGRFVRRYHPEDPHDARWCADVAAWTSALARGLHALSPPIALIANVAPLDGPEPTCVQAVTDHLDGLVDEGGFMRSDLRAPLEEREWVSRVKLMARLQHEGRAYYSINEFAVPPSPQDFCAPVVSHGQLQWALASYLMGKEHAAAVFVSGLEQYGCALWYPEFDAPIGHPCGEMRREAGVYVRDYSHGMVVTNASYLGAIYTLPGDLPYTDLQGTQVGSAVPLAAHSGVVLLAGRSAAGRCP
ncbi:MAG TPA: putative glycoside hydrolase [Polyangiaceae bacterium]